jgi:hypothetical protein
MIASLRPLLRLPFPTRLRAGLACAAVLVLTAGCQLIPDPAPDPTRFFVLTGPGLPAATTTAQGTLRLGLRSVELPAYLRSRSLLVRNGRNELTYDDYARWAEPLDDGIARVLRARLVATPAVERVYAHPFPFNRERDFDVSVTVIRCEGVREPGGSAARFAAVVEITRASTGTVVSRQTFVAPDASWDGQDHAALVAALSEAVGQLAEAVTAQLPSNRPE